MSDAEDDVPPEDRSPVVSRLRQVALLQLRSRCFLDILTHSLACKLFLCALAEPSLVGNCCKHFRDNHD
eukprot:1233422-Amphidinium_carterae.1